MCFGDGEVLFLLQTACMLNGKVFFFYAEKMCLV